MAGRSNARGRAFGIVALLAAAVAGCSAQSPLAPDPVSAAPVAAPINVTALPGNAALAAPALSPAVKTKAKARFTFRFDMLKGDLTLVFGDGSAIMGSYSGVALNPTTGQPRATLEGAVTSGTGIFTGATGTFSGVGTGGFAGTGEFTVSLRGDVTRANGRTVDLRVTLKGTVASICTTEAPPRLFLDGTGASKGLGAVIGHLEHDLGTEACAIIVID